MTINAEKDFIVTQDAPETAGAISYWRLSGDVDLDKLRAAWIAAGLDPAVLPARPSQETALHRAVQTLAAKRRLVRPLGNRNEWAIVDETVIDTTISHNVIAHVRYVKDSAEQVQINVQGAGYDEENLAPKIRAEYLAQRGRLAATDVSGWLIRQAAKLQAVTLRDLGGIYFIPRGGVDYWRKVADVVEAVSSHRVFKIPALKNTEAVAAILDAITQEAATVAAAIEEELRLDGDDKLGDRAIRTRATTCAALLTKVGGYEELLGVKLDEIRARVIDLQSNLAIAGLADSGDGAERDPA